MNLIGRRVLPTLAVLVLLIASLKLAEQAAGGSGAFVDAYRWVLGAAVLALLVLFVLMRPAPVRDGPAPAWRCRPRPATRRRAGNGRRH